MYELREKRFKIFFAILTAAFLLAVGVLAIMEVSNISIENSLISAVKINLDMFKSFAAFKAWLAAVPYYYYVFIGLGLFVFSVLMIALAVCKKARFRRNDVNVLIMVGDSEEKVDATVFKEHYAVVVVSKSSNMAPVKPKVMQSIIPLEDDRRFIPIPNEDPTIRNDIDEDSASTVEEIVFTNTDVSETDKVDESVNVTEEVQQNVEEIKEDAKEEVKEEPKPEPVAEPKKKLKGKARREEQVVKEVVEQPPVEQAPIIVGTSHEPEDTFAQYVVDDSYNIYDVAPNDEMVFAEEPVLDYNQPIPEPNQPQQQYQEIEIDMDEVFDQVYADADAVNAEEEALYNDSEFTTEGFEEVGFDMNELNVMPIVVSAPSEREEDDFEPYVPTEVDQFECVTIEEDKPPMPIEDVKKTADTTIEVAEFEPQVFVTAKDEEVVFMPVEEKVEEATFEEIYEEPIVQQEVEQVVEKKVEQVVEKKVEEVAPVIIAPIILDDVDENKKKDAKSKALADVDEEGDIVAIIPAFAKTDDLAYTIVKQENATQEAIDDMNNGALIVDADGDGIIDEVLEDKDILKMRYKTVDLDKRLRRTDEEVKGYYSEIKNVLLSYTGIKSRLSKKFDTFTLGRFIVGKIALRGKVINLYLALPNEQVEDKYFAEDVSDSETYGKTPTLHKVKSKRGCKYAVELIKELMTALGMETNANYESTDYVAMYPPENIEEKKAEILELITDRIYIEDTDVLSDEEALEFIQIVKNKERTINKFNPINKYVAYLDDIADLYEDGDTVTISNLIEKGALPNEDNLFLEIRAKGTLDKCLTIEAHSFDVKAVKMITLTNGNVIQYK